MFNSKKNLDSQIIYTEQLAKKLRYIQKKKLNNSLINKRINK